MRDELRFTYLVAFADSNGGLPQSVELSPARYCDAEIEFANNLLQFLIAFEGRHSIPTFGPGLQPGLPHSTGAGSLPRALRFVTAS
jgi:hypothetical protein